MPPQTRSTTHLMWLHISPKYSHGAGTFISYLQTHPHVCKCKTLASQMPRLIPIAEYLKGVFSTHQMALFQMMQACRSTLKNSECGEKLRRSSEKFILPRNTTRTRAIVQQLIQDGFMVDYAPDVSRGDFFRAVINSQTTRGTIDRLVEAVQRHSKSGRTIIS